MKYDDDDESEFVYLFSAAIASSFSFTTIIQYYTSDHALNGNVLTERKPQQESGRAVEGESERV